MYFYGGIWMKKQYMSTIYGAYYFGWIFFEEEVFFEKFEFRNDVLLKV